MQSTFPDSPFHSIGKGQIQVAQFYVQFSHQLAQFCMQFYSMRDEKRRPLRDIASLFKISVQMVRRA